MVYEVVRSTQVDRDLLLIFRHLVDSYSALGEPLLDAFQRAAQRIETVKADMKALGRMPHQGTQVFNLYPGLRRVTKKRAIFYFVVNDETRTIQVAAIFFGGQDHGHHIIERLGKAGS